MAAAEGQDAGGMAQMSARSHEMVIAMAL